MRHVHVHVCVRVLRWLCLLLLASRPEPIRARLVRSRVHFQCLLAREHKCEPWLLEDEDFVARSGRRRALGGRASTIVLSRSARDLAFIL